MYVSGNRKPHQVKHCGVADSVPANSCDSHAFQNYSVEITLVNNGIHEFTNNHHLPTP